MCVYIGIDDENPEGGDENAYDEGDGIWRSLLLSLFWPYG